MLDLLENIHLPYNAALLQVTGNVFKLMIGYKKLTLQNF